MLVVVLSVASFFGGMALQKQLDQPKARYRVDLPTSPGAQEILVLPDGTVWTRPALSDQQE
jgi:hypothetical protein